MSMNARQTVKLLLAAAVFVLVFRMLLGKGRAARDRYENNSDMFFDAGAAEQESFEDIDVPITDESYESYQDGAENIADNETYAPMTANAPLPSSVPAVPSRGLATALLPKPAGRMTGGEDWSEFAPKDALKNQNFLDATKFIGVNTQGSSLKNANYDLRSSMPIPKADVGPWSGSSIDPDLMRRPLE
jgi:hypothetical protein